MGRLRTWLLDSAPETATDTAAQDGTFQLGKWHVDPMLSRISCADEIVKIEPQNMKLLLRLAAEPGSVVSLEEIEGTVWRGLVVTPNSVYQSVAQLRRALGDSKVNPTYIETVPRKGYRLVAPVTPESAAIAQVDEVLEPQVTAVVPAELGPRRARRWLTHTLLIAVPGIVALSLLLFFYGHDERDPIATALENFQPAENSSGEVTPENGSRSARAYMLTELGMEALRLGQKKSAQAHFEEAFALQAQVSDRNDPKIAGILTKLAIIDFWDANYVPAEAKAREAVQILERTAPPLHPNIPRAHDVLANILISSGRYAEANVHAAHSLESARLLYGDSHIRVVGAEDTLTLLRMAEGRLDEAEQWARRALEDAITINGKDDVTVLYQRTSLAMVLYKQGRYAQAATEATNAIETLARLNLPNHPYGASARQVLGESLIELEKYDGAERVLLEELRILKSDEAENRWRIARATSALGEARLRQGRIAEAESHLTFASRELAAVKGWSENEARLATQERMQQLQRVKAEQTLLAGQ